MSATDVSGDGSIQVGLSNAKAVYWDDEGLHPLNMDVGLQSDAETISPSGNYIGGWIFYREGLTAIIQAVVWDADRNLVRLSHADGSPFQGRVTDVSDHGYAVGVTKDLKGFIWHPDWTEPQIFDDWLETKKEEGDPSLPTPSTSVVAVAEDTIEGKLLFAVNGSSYFVQVDAPELLPDVHIVSAGPFTSFVDMGLNPDTGEVVLLGTQKVAEVDVAKVFELDEERTAITSETLSGLDDDPNPLVGGISSDGTRIAGVSKSNDSVDIGEGTTWLSSAPASPVGIGYVAGKPNTSVAFGAWSDGVVGDYNGLDGAITWTPSGGIGILAGNSDDLQQSVDVNADGSIQVGFSTLGSLGPKAVYWDAEGLHVLGNPTGGGGQATTVSPDGSYIGGWNAYYDDLIPVLQAVVWDASREIVPLSYSADGSPFEGFVLDVSNHGYAVGITLDNQGFIWHPDWTEPQIFDDWLGEISGGVSPPSASTSIVAISEDDANTDLLFAVNGADPGNAYFVGVDFALLQDVAPPATFHDPGDGSFALTARNPNGVQEPGVPITYNGTAIDGNTYQVIDLNDKVPGVDSFPTTLTDIIANTFLRASYQKQDGTTGSFTTSVVASPSFRTDDEVFHYVPEVAGAAIVTNGADYYQNTVTGTFPGLATLETIRRMPDPALEQTTVQLDTHWEATADVALATSGAFAGNDRLRELTVSSMFSSDAEFDANLIRFEDADGLIRSVVLTNATPRDSHLFDEPVEIGGWFELAKTTDSTWQPDSPTARIRIVNDGGVRLGLQGWLAATTLTSDDSLTVWLEDLDSPDVIPAGTGRSLQFEMIATPPVPYDFGDAPENYPSRLADDGARHAILNELVLGGGVGGEADGQPSADASGDGQEDGVGVVAAPFSGSTMGSTASFLVEASGAGKLDAWMDFNRDGDWDDTGEQIASTISVAAGGNVVAYTIPAGLSEGNTAARFRFSSAGGLAPTGMAADGEVEDYWIDIGASSGTREATVVSPGSGTTFVVDASQISATHDGATIFEANRADVDTLTIEHDADDTLEIAGQWQGEEGAIVDGKFQHVFTSAESTLRIVNTKPWQNPILRFDTDGNGFVEPVDVLLTINEINAKGSRTLPFPQSAAEVKAYFDSDGDNFIAPVDILLRINYLNWPAGTRGGEGESPAAGSMAVAGLSFLPELTWPLSGQANTHELKLVTTANLHTQLDLSPWYVTKRKASDQSDLLSEREKKDSTLDEADEFWSSFGAASDLFGNSDLVLADCLS